MGLLYKSLRKKNIILNGKKATGKEMLYDGDRVDVWFSEDTIKKFAPASRGKQSERLSSIIVYEDENIVICNKPANLLSQRDGSGADSLNDWLLDYYEPMEGVSPSICNRLDRNTTGLIVAGKTIQALQGVNELFKTRQVEKWYDCLVVGVPADKGVLKGYLKKDRERNKVTISEAPEGASWPVETRYQLMKIIHKKGEALSWLRVELITGRPHQIRAHMAYMGNPIIGDLKYGNDDSLRISAVLDIKRPLLHCCHIRFPKLKEPLQKLSELEFIAPWPDDMKIE